MSTTVESIIVDAEDAAGGNGHGHHNVEAVKQALRGRAVDVLEHVAGIPRDVLDGRHHPCPLCGGKDRFRLIDAEVGAVYCNNCFDSKNGDALAAVQHFRNVEFPEALPLVGEYLGIQGIQPSPNGHAKQARSQNLLKKVQWIPLDSDQWNAIVSEWCKYKPPITPEAVAAFRGRFCVWPTKGPGNRCVAFPGYNLNRELKALLLYRLDGKPFPVLKGLGERKTHLVGGSRESWIVPGQLDDLIDATTLVKCEGLTDALALWSIGLPKSWVPITNACGARSANPEKLDFSIGANKQVPIMGDADQPGQEGGQGFAVAFCSAGASEVKVPALPYEVLPDHGKDLRDWLAEGHGVEDFLALVDAAEPVTAEQVAEWGRAKTNNPRILVGFDEARVADEAIRAIVNEPNLYQRGGKLVQVVTNTKPPRGIARPTGAPRIAMLRQARLREIMADHAKWATPGDDGPTPCHVPRWAVEAVAARDQWEGIRPIEGVVEAPVLRADGTILQQPGYDSLTGLLFQPRGAFPEIPERLTVDGARRAVDALLESVADFPFATPAHKAAWLAATLTPFARFAFYGCAPLNLIDANVRGCGKGLLADVTGAIFCWREMSRMPKAGDDDEFRKRITALAIAGDPLILIDNIVGFLGSPSLDAALTATSWSDRVLGKSEMVTDVPLTATWYATANNAILGADTARRVLHIRLESPEE
ncbi:MAG: primase-helicase zinc-binding domain-containing protein, partial [Planctomycetota bacterium]